MITLQQIFQTYGPGYLQAYGKSMPANHRKVIQAIMDCQTERSGFALYRCDDCGQTASHPRSCGNRHCPTCQYGKTQAWLQEHLRKQLPCAHFLVTFTVPEALRTILRQHARKGLGALFRASSETLKTFIADERNAGAHLPGFFGVLHTWGGQMQYHPHIHYVVVGGGLTQDRVGWMPSGVKFLAPVPAMSMVFRARLKAALGEEGLCKDIPRAVWRKNFVVNVQPVGCAQNTLRYLATYVFRVAISNHRIIKVENDRVFFRYRVSKTKVYRTMSLPAYEFLRRFLQHVLPKSFVKVRYYGFYAHAAKVNWNALRTCIQLTGNALLSPEQEEALQNHEPPAAPERSCHKCGGELVYVDTLLPRGGRLVSVRRLQGKEAKTEMKPPGG